jgi:hypothetical protein
VSGYKELLAIANTAMLTLAPINHIIHSQTLHVKSGGILPCQEEQLKPNSETSQHWREVCTKVVMTATSF